MSTLLTLQSYISDMTTGHSSPANNICRDMMRASHPEVNRNLTMTSCRLTIEKLIRKQGDIIRSTFIPDNSRINWNPFL